MANTTDHFLHSYHWISATRIGSTPQQTHVMLRHDVSDAYIYIEPFAGEIKSPQDVIGLGLWANTRSYLVFIEGLSSEQAQSMERLTQTPVK